VRWAHVSDFRTAQIRVPFLRLAAPDSGSANAILYRLNRALVLPASGAEKLLRISLGGYFDGFVLNAYGVETEQLARALQRWQARAEPAVVFAPPPPPKRSRRKPGS
jgi:hypothetical protein